MPRRDPAPKPPAARVRITVDFAPEDLARIDRAARETGTSRSALIRDAAIAKARRVLGKEGKR